MPQGTVGGKAGSTWNQWFREWLATIVVVISLIAVTVLGTIAIIHSDNKGSSAQSILTMVLPMIGTWVGTVLAFYFGKEQLEAATRSVTAIAQQLTPEEKLKSTKVTSTMIPRAEMKVFTDDPSTLKLFNALEQLESEKKGNRLPILTAQGQPLHVIHRSFVDRFISKKAKEGLTPDQLKNLTLADLLKDPEFQKLTTATFAVVPSSATLADAKSAMEALKPWCQDVFVISSTGEPVIGWITNSIIEANARV